MNKKEKAKLQEALHHLMDNPGADYSKGIGLICEVLGLHYPAYHDTRELRSIRIQDIPLGPGKLPKRGSHDPSRQVGHKCQ